MERFRVCERTLGSLSLLCVVSLAFWKPYETSHAFRGATDPSQYDDLLTWFSEVNPPLAKVGPKNAMRIYIFVLPFTLAFVFALFSLLAGARAQARETATATALEQPPPTQLSHANAEVQIGQRQTRARFFRLRAVFSKQVPFPAWTAWFGFPVALTCGEIVGMMCFLALNLAVIGARVERSLENGARKLHFLKSDRQGPIDPYSFEAVEVQYTPTHTPFLSIDMREREKEHMLC